MNTTEFAKEQTPLKPKSNATKNALLAVLSIAVVGLGAYTIVDKSNSSAAIEKQQNQIAQISSEKSDIQKSFDGSLARLDSLGSVTASLESTLKEKNSEIDKTKAEIRSILNKKNATAAELSKAKNLIASLNEKISGMEQDIARLTQENQTLTQEKTVLAQEKQQLTTDLATTTTVKQELEKKVDIASTLQASNITITPINVKGNGKEKVTTTAKRVDKLKISFDVDNRIAKSGSTDIYVCILGPDGNAISQESLGSGSFTTREEGDKPFTGKVPIAVETGKKKLVEFAFQPSGSFQQGQYTIQIYQNGYLIGQSKQELKKGGLFS